MKAHFLQKKASSKSLCPKSTSGHKCGLEPPEIQAQTTLNPGSNYSKSGLRPPRISGGTTPNLCWNHPLPGTAPSHLTRTPTSHAASTPPFYPPTLIPPHQCFPPRGDTGALTKGQRCWGGQSRWHTDLLIALGCWCPRYPPGARGTGRAGLGGAKRCHFHPPSVHWVGGNGSK